MTSQINYDERLLHGIKSGQTNLIATSLPHLGGNINTVVLPKTNRGILSSAALYGHKNIVKHLVTKGAQVNKTDGDGKTAIYISSLRGDLDIVKLLASKGANLNQMDQLGNTPLTTSLQHNQIEVAKFLITSGANVNKVGSEGKTPLSWAVYNNNPDLVKMLLEHGAGFTANSAFLDAIGCRNLNLIKILRESGALVNLEGVDEYTPLIKAVEMEHFEIVKYLIEQGAKIDQKDDQEKTPLSIAASNHDLRIFDFLIKSGADVQLAITEVEKYANDNMDFAIYLNSLKKRTQIKTEDFDLVDV